MTPEQVSELIRNRRSVFPPAYNGQPISREILLDIMENANWAPTHKLTEPWRFQVFTGEALKDLSDHLSGWYKTNTPEEKFSEVTFKKMKENPLKAAAVIGVILRREPAESLPEWEEIAAVACAVQNMYLTCEAYGIGCYWATPPAATRAKEFFHLEGNDRCLGLFYMGYSDLPKPPGKRTPVSEKITWR